MVIGKQDGELRSGSARMLKGWRLLGIFALLAVLFAMFFGAGYGLGLTQNDTPVPAEASTLLGQPENAKDGVTTATSLPGANRPVVPAFAKPPSTTGLAPGKISKSSSRSSISGGTMVLQVSAEHSQSGALALAGDLKRDGFAAFVLAPNTDNFFRVQIGPYSDVPSANMARKQLEEHGYRPVIARYDDPSIDIAEAGRKY